MAHHETYFVGRKYGQAPTEWRDIVTEVTRMPGVKVMATGRSTIEVAITKKVVMEFKRRFGSVAEIEHPISFDPAA